MDRSDTYTTEPEEPATMSLPKRITAAQAVNELRLLDSDDPEEAHHQADEILLATVPDSVREEYRALQNRTSWWAHA